MVKATARRIFETRLRSSMGWLLTFTAKWLEQKHRVRLLQKPHHRPKVNDGKLDAWASMAAIETKTEGHCGLADRRSVCQVNIGALKSSIQDRPQFSHSICIRRKIDLRAVGTSPDVVRSAVCDAWIAN